MMRIVPSVLLSSVLFVPLLASLAIAGGSIEKNSRKCSAALKKAGADHAHCLLDAEAKHEKKRNDRRLARNIDFCDSRFDRAFKRAMRRYPDADCATVSKEELIDETDSYVFRYSNSTENIPNLGTESSSIPPYNEAECLSGYCTATTTIFGGMDQNWPLGGEPPYLYASGALKSLGFTAVATPFAIQLKQNNSSRSEYINNVIADAAGDHRGDGMCFQLDSGELLIPQQFCGGDGWPLCRPGEGSCAASGPTAWPPVEWDVQNFCSGIVSAYVAGKAGLVSLCEDPTPNCEGVCTLVNLTNGDPNWLDLSDPANMQSFIDHGSCLPSKEADTYPYQLPPVTGTGSFDPPCSDGSGSSAGQYNNWCSGRNMHFDGMPINETVKFKVVHCDINGAKKVGVSAPPPPPAPKPVPNQLVINYTGSLAETSCQPPYPYSGGATTIHAHTPTPVTGSETADKVQCYGPSVTFIHSDNVWSNSSGSSDCTPYAGVDGAYTCTVTDAP